MRILALLVLSLASFSLYPHNFILKIDHDGVYKVTCENNPDYEFTLSSTEECTLTISQKTSQKFEVFDGIFCESKAHHLTSRRWSILDESGALIHHLWGRKKELTFLRKLTPPNSFFALNVSIRGKKIMSVECAEPTHLQLATMEDILRCGAIDN